MGSRVLGLDQAHPPHTLGSSHGETRITRLAIGEGHCYTPFALRSHELWRAIEGETGCNLMRATGGLVIGDESRAGRFHNKPGFLRQTFEAAARYGIRHERLSACEIRARYPQFNVSDSESAYFEYEAGYLRPEECVRAQLELALSRGATVRCGERVSDVRQASGGGVVVRTELGEYHGDQLVVAAGAWVTRLIPELRSECRVTRQVLYWFSIERSYASFSPDRCPIFLWSFGVDEEQGLYGFPAIDGPSGGVKLASSAFGEVVDPDTVDRVVSEEEQKIMYEQLVRERLPLVEPRCLRATTCLYTVTPDSDFIIERLSSMPEVLAVSPCSGHGFKHSAAIGECVAELVVRGSTRFDISYFSRTRRGGDDGV